MGGQKPHRLPASPLAVDSDWGLRIARGGRGSQSKRVCPRNVSAGSRQTRGRERSRQHPNETRRAHTSSSLRRLNHLHALCTPLHHPVLSTTRHVATTHEKDQTSHISTIGFMPAAVQNPHTHTHTHTVDSFAAYCNASALHPQEKRLFRGAHIRLCGSALPLLW